MTNQSSPTIIRSTTFEFEQQMILTNKEQFEILLATFIPELYRIHMSLLSSLINPSIIPAIIYALERIARSYGDGDVIISIEKDHKTGVPKVKRIRSVDRVDPNVPLIIK